MAGFLTYYLFGMESCDMLSDNYIHEVIKKNNHAFLLGLQGNNLLSFNPHTLSKRGLSYRTASLTLHIADACTDFIRGDPVLVSGLDRLTHQIGNG